MHEVSDLNTLKTFLNALFYAGSGPKIKNSNDVDYYLECFQEEMFMHTMSMRPYPAKLYRELKDFLQITSAQYKEIMGHTWKTVQTKKANELLSTDYSEKLISAAKVWAQGITFFGNEEKFNHWLRQHNPFLDSKPIDLLTTINGSEIVSDELERLHEGVLA